VLRDTRRGLGLAAFTLPSWLVVLGVVIVPVGFGIYLSFGNASFASLDPPAFVGFTNYQTEVLAPSFLNAAWATALIAGLGLLIQFPIGIGLALLLNRELRGMRIIRSSLLIPMLLTPVAVGLMWRFMLNSDLGLINWLLRTFGLPGIQWLGDQRMAIVSVVIVDSWQSIPFIMLFMLAGLAGLPVEPREAANVDGASSWQALRHVTLPMLGPVILIVLMIRIIEAVKMFDVVYVLTQGGPGTATQNLSLLTYRVGFQYLATSRGAALGITLTLLMLPAYWLWWRATRDD
jgi:multiple sugar transport system permease protein